MKTLMVEPTGKRAELIYSKRSEGNIQHFVAGALERLGYEVCWEVCFAGGRFDLVIYDAETLLALAIVETKAFELPYLHGKYQTVYATFGVPVYVVPGMEAAKEFIADDAPHLARNYAAKYAEIPIVAMPTTEGYLNDRRARRRKEGIYRTKF